MNKVTNRQPRWTEEADPFAALERDYLRQMRWPRGWGQRSQRNEWTPVVDMFDKGDHLVVRAELPGVPEEDIDLTLEKGILTIKGERKPDPDINGDEWLCCERASGVFYRAIQMPAEIDSERVTADYKYGVLTINLPKLPKEQPKKVSIAVA